VLITLFRVWYIQDFCIFWVQFRQVSLYLTIEVGGRGEGGFKGYEHLAPLSKIFQLYDRVQFS
jgi:hypothetical protein